MIGLGLSITQLAVRQLLGFNPLSLFAANEPGVWYDPSDLTTMFQDAAGTTPVTAVEQPVGLILDKSRGLVLGPELVTNGTFDGNIITGWAGNNATLSSTSDALIVTPTTTNATAYAVVNLVVGKSYVVEADIVAVNGSTQGKRLNVGTTITGNQMFQYIVASTPQSMQGIFVATATVGYVNLYSFDGTNATVWDNISVRELPGAHATQTTATSRPVLKQDAGFQKYLKFDGIDDSLVTPTITPGTDKVQVFAGVRHMNTAATGSVFETSADAGANAGAIALYANTTSYSWRTGGSTRITASANVTPPITHGVTNLGDISGDLATLRLNGTQAAQSTADQGTGNFGNYPLYIGRRNNASLPFNGHLYPLIVRFGPNLTADQITQTETWVNSKTGAY